jgi:hypothetical protein
LKANAWQIRLGALLVFGMFTGMAHAEKPLTKFYDFSETVITSDAKVPGLSLILGDAFAPSDCPQLDADAFRRCIGEVQDVFRYVQPGRQVPLDVAIVPIGRGALTLLKEGMSDAVRNLESTKMLPRLFLVPHPQSMPGAYSQFKRMPLHYEWRRTTRGLAIRGIKAALAGISDLGVAPPGLIALQALLDERTMGRSPLRKNGMLAVVVVATDVDVWGRIEMLRESLNRVYGPAGWSVVIHCSKHVCDGFRDLAHQPSNDVMSMEDYSLGQVAQRVVEDANWRVNRWTLSTNPGLYGDIELRSGRRVLDKGYFSYDPFERRIRVSDIRLPVAEGSVVEAWYFPFDPMQGLVSACPEAARVQPGDGAPAPCKGWVADEVIGPAPASKIDVFFVGRPRGKTAIPPEEERAFRRSFERAGVDVRVMTGRRPKWRKGAFHMVVSGRNQGRDTHKGDAFLTWENFWSTDALESLGWRVINRSIQIHLRGMPLVYETLKVYLNGRKIEAATDDGAGYILKEGKLFLDVAAPIHPQSHVFLTYKRSE